MNHPIFIILFSILINADRWFKIFVEKNVLDGKELRRSDIKTLSSIHNLYIAQLLSEIHWATLGCILSTTELVVSTGRISPFYKNITEES